MSNLDLSRTCFENLVPPHTTSRKKWGGSQKQCFDGFSQIYLNPACSTEMRKNGRAGLKWSQGDARIGWNWVMVCRAGGAVELPRLSGSECLLDVAMIAVISPRGSIYWEPNRWNWSVESVLLTVGWDPSDWSGWELIFIMWDLTLEWVHDSKIKPRLLSKWIVM